MERFEGSDIASAAGVLTKEGLRRACGHVWRDSNSIVMLGADVLNSEPVSFNDKQALTALQRHIAAAGPRAFVEDVLPNLGFGPVPGLTGTEERFMKQHENATGGKIICVKCGKEDDPLHLGCSLCEDCCDCRPAGT